MSRPQPAVPGDVEVPAPMPAGEAETYQRLRGHLATLQLAAAAAALTGVLDAARSEQLSIVTTLERLLRVEVEVAAARRLAGRPRFACLPAPWSITDFDFTAQPGVDGKLIHELASLRFLDDAGNVLFVGPPGTGKTMLAIGLARAAVDAGHRVYFTTAEDLAKRCKRAALDGRWGHRAAVLLRPPPARHRRIRLRPRAPRPGCQHGSLRGDQPALSEEQHDRHFPCRRRGLGGAARGSHAGRGDPRPTAPSRRGRRHQRNARLQLTVVLASDRPVDGLYANPQHRRRLRRPAVQGAQSV